MIAGGLLVWRAWVVLGAVVALAGCGAASSTASGGQDPVPVAATATPSPTSADDTTPSSTPAPVTGPGTPDASGSSAPDAVPGTGPAALTVTVTKVVDGDTLDASGVGRVRLKGIDAPEVGACGSADATARLSSLVLHRQVTLVAGGRDDRDGYGRLLRYVDVAGADAGRDLVGAGLAKARYDSRDGYGAHPRERDYIALDAQATDKTCAPAAAAPAAETPPATPKAATTPKSTAPKAASSDSSSSSGSAQPWNQPGPDLDCSDIRRKVRITGPDYHHLDADGDGWGCDSYG